MCYLLFYYKIEKKLYNKTSSTIPIVKLWSVESQENLMRISST